MNLLNICPYQLRQNDFCFPATEHRSQEKTGPRKLPGLNPPSDESKLIPENIEQVIKIHFSGLIILRKTSGNLLTITLISTTVSFNEQIVSED